MKAREKLILLGQVLTSVLVIALSWANLKCFSEMGKLQKFGLSCSTYVSNAAVLGYWLMWLFSTDMVRRTRRYVLILFGALLLVILRLVYWAWLCD